MIKIDNTIYRNLEEQVAKNQEDIRGLKFGLNIVGSAVSASYLPDDAEEGDTYLVGLNAPYSIYVRVADGYMDLGTLESTVEGPQGETGAQGEKGNGIASAYLDDDSVLHIVYDDETDQTISNIKGERGLTGKQGPKGDKGDQGEQGEQGVQGETGITFQIVGHLTSIASLPDPEIVDPNYAYLIKNSDITITDTYYMYIVVGEPGSKVWFNSGLIHTDDETLSQATSDISALETAVANNTTDIALKLNKTDLRALPYDIVPNEAEAYDIGSEDFPYSSIWGTQLFGEKIYYGINYTDLEATLTINGDDISDNSARIAQKANITTTDALDARLSLVETLIKPTYYFVESVDTFLTRETGEGQNVIDDSDATINSITGHSEVCSNLLSDDDFVAAASDGTITGTYAPGTIIVNNKTYRAGTYTVSIKVNTATANDSYIAIYNNTAGTGTRLSSLMTVGTTTYTFTITESSVIRYYISGASADNITIQIWVNSGDTALPFEPYYEGIKSATATTITSDTGFKKIAVGDTIDNFCMTAEQLKNINSTYTTSRLIAKFVDSIDSSFQLIWYDAVWGVRHQKKNADNTFVFNITIEPSSNYTYTFDYPLTTVNIIPDYVQTNTGTSKQYPTDLTFPTSTFTIPAAIRALDGYGVEGNIVDFENGTYTQINEVVDGAVVALTTPIITDISAYITSTTYKVWKNGTEKFDCDVAPTLNSIYFVSRVEEEQ